MIKTLADINTLVEQGMTKEQALFHKLCLCMHKIEQNYDKLGCHFITTAKYLGRCIESNYTYYDTLMDVWSNYFLSD